MMKTLRLVLAACAAFSLGGALRAGDAGQVTAVGYELYSWQESNGGWTFCVLYNTSREKTVEEVFSKKTLLRGVDDLERKIASLPEGASIFWVDRLPSGSGPKAKGSEALRYPPAEFIEKVKRYAASRHIDIKVLGQ